MSELSARGIDVCAQAGVAFGKKGNLDMFFQDTADLFYPERADFTVTRSQGEDFASKLYASEPVLFRRDFGNYLGAVLRPSGRDWFKPRARNDEINEMSSVRKYLEPRGRVLRNLLYDTRSQFTRSQTQADHDYVTFGNSSSSVDRRLDGMGYRFRTWHLRSCAWRENYDGEIDTHFRRFKESVRNLCSRQRSDKWTVSPKISQRLEKSPDDMVNCLHIVMQIEDYDYTRKIKKDKFGELIEWISLYVDEDNKWVMSEKEQPDFNYIVSRWYTISGSPYAYSPCVVCATPDSRSLQVMTWSIIEAGEKAVEPPMIAQKEAVLSGIDLRAGMVTWVDQRYDERTGEVVRPVELGGHPQFGEALRQGIVQNINSAFYLNKLFLPPPANQPMTAQEASLRNDEYLRIAEPIISPAEPERNGKMLDLTMRMAIRDGYWGPIEDMPKELQGQWVEFTYDNPVEDARRRGKAQAYDQSMHIIDATKKIGDAASAVQFDNDTAFREAILGVAPPAWLLDDDQAKEATDAARQQQAQMAQAQMAAGAANNVAALANTDAEIGVKKAQTTKLAA